MSTAFIILAAGKGTRMQSDLPKVLHEVAAAPMLVHAMKTAQAMEPERMVVVTGHGSEAVERVALDWDEAATCVLQAEQLGTGHAVDQARGALEGFEGIVFVLYGDTPFIRPKTLADMAQALETSDICVLGFEAEDPARYGRLVTDGDQLLRIVEFKDASNEERAITLCNSGVMAAKASVLFDLLAQVGNDNASGEYYLTDVPGLGSQKELTTSVVRCPEDETLGVNSRTELAQAEAIFQARARADALELGVTMQAPETVYFSHDTYIGRDVLIEPNVVFGPGVTVETGARIRAFSHLEGCHVSRGAIVGPYARLRPGAEIHEDAKIGNFVEIKDADVHEGAKVNHLSYVGNASLGKGTNVGAGTITCNYDGVMKHRTTVGERAFIGSNTMLVAPVTVGDEAMTGSGSVITSDVPEGALAIGRARQATKPGLARKLMAHLRALKAKKD